MHVVAGLDLGGASLIDQGQLHMAAGTIGQVSWGPSQLLRDLELRLGLTSALASEALRVARWAAKMAALAPRGRFYSKSFEVDVQGTAAAVLKLRDALVEAGWNGEAITDGGVRLDAIHELEQLGTPLLPAGAADRLGVVAGTLGEGRRVPYAALTLMESIERWPARWQLVLRALERAGTRLARPSARLSGAPSTTDLGQAQAAIRGEAIEERLVLRGDGSLLLVTADTAWEAARVAAAILATLPGEGTVVIRQHDCSALDNALAAQGLRTQGLRSISPWRSALQVLPLALELSFEPKDPYRVLELLTLPVGPFQGFVGHALARALAESPGIGSPAWDAVKVQLRTADERSERGAQQVARVTEWFEQSGSDAVTGADPASLVRVVERVRTWILSRIAADPDNATLLTAARCAGDFRAALESDVRPMLTLVEVRKLAESVLGTGTNADLLAESAGRVAHVDSPAALAAAREVVFWWSFVDERGTEARLPWRYRELAALARAGLHFPEPEAGLAERAQSTRRAFCCATRQVILVAPRASAGKVLPLHPLWDELLARAGADEAALACVTVSARELLEPSSDLPLRERPETVRHDAVGLPGGGAEWAVPAADVAPIDHFSSSSLNALLGCPLRWVLQYRAGVYSGGHSLKPLFMLNGSLGHRLIELLHAQGAFSLDESPLRERATQQLELLFEREGAVLLRSGMAFERSQLAQQLVRAVLELARLLRGAGLSIVAVEKDIRASWQGGNLEGRIDLLVRAEAGAHAIIDVKWGIAEYRGLLKSGQALQLAAYAFAHASERGERVLPEAAYFSLKQGKLFGLPSTLLPHAETIDGPNLQDTWRRVERSVARTARLVSEGRFPVTGVQRSLPLLTSLDVPEAEHDNHFTHDVPAGCKHCGFDALCGRRWEALQ